MANKQEILFTQLEDILGYRFSDKSLLVEAITHRSYSDCAVRSGMRDNQRLEFFGDAVLNLLVTSRLLQEYPEYDSGYLSRLRASLVDESSLAAVADNLRLGRFLLMGRGEEKSGGRRKRSVLADAVEAVIGAVYLDGGFVATEILVSRLFEASFMTVTLSNASSDCKSRLQELAHSLNYPAPFYVINDVSGPDHALHFTVTVVISSDCFAKGAGSTRKEAEQEAARQGIFLLEEELRLKKKGPRQ